MALLSAISIVCLLKGKYLWATLGWFTGWHWIAALRLAKPDSWWARRLYGPEKLAAARARFGAVPMPAVASPPRSQRARDAPQAAARPAPQPATERERLAREIGLDG